MAADGREHNGVCRRCCRRRHGSWTEHVNTIVLIRLWEQKKMETNRNAAQNKMRMPPKRFLMRFYFLNKNTHRMKTDDTVFESAWEHRIFLSFFLVCGDNNNNVFSCSSFVCPQIMRLENRNSARNEWRERKRKKRVRRVLAVVIIMVVPCTKAFQNIHENVAND